MGMLIKKKTQHSGKHRTSQEVHFPQASFLYHTVLKWKLFPRLLGQQSTDLQCTNKQVRTFVVPSENLKSYSCNPRKLAKKREEERHAGYLSLHLEVLLITRAGAVSELLWERGMCQWRKQDQEQFALSGTSKPIHLKMWPLPFWLPHCALDGHVLFKRKALLGWGQLKCIP